MLERTARWCYRKRRMVLVLWIVAFVGLGVVGQLGRRTVQHRLRHPRLGVQGRPRAARRASSRSGRATPSPSSTRPTAASPTRPCGRGSTRLLAQLRTDPHVVGVVTRTTPRAPSRSRQIDRTIAFATLQLDIQGSDIPVDDAKDMIDAAEAADGDGGRREVRARRPGHPERRVRERRRLRGRSASWPPSSSCWSPSGRCWPWACRSSPRSWASASAWPSSSCWPTSSTSPTSPASWPP